MVNRQDKKFKLMWIGANTFGAALGFAMGFNLAGNFGGFGLFTLNKAVFCLSIGGTIGVAQWLVVRRHIRANLLWILVTTAGWSIGFGTNFPIFFVITSYLVYIINSVLIFPITLAISCFVWGLLVGALQWLILVFQVRYAYRWLRINLWAISVSFIITGLRLRFYIPPPHSENFFPEYVVKSFFMGLFGLIYGILTAEVLVKLLQHPKSSPEE